MKAIAKDGLDSGGRARDQRNGPRRRDRGDLGMRSGSEPANRLSANAGKAPRSLPRRADAACAACWMQRATRSANRTPCSLSYGMPTVASISAKPITPRPILRVARVASSSSEKG